MDIEYEKKLKKEIEQTKDPIDCLDSFFDDVEVGEDELTNGKLEHINRIFAEIDSTNRSRDNNRNAHEDNNSKIQISSLNKVSGRYFATDVTGNSWILPDEDRLNESDYYVIEESGFDTTLNLKEARAIGEISFNDDSIEVDRLLSNPKPVD